MSILPLCLHGSSYLKKPRLYYLQELMNVKVFSGVSTTVTWDDTHSQSLMLQPIRSVYVI